MFNQYQWSLYLNSGGIEVCKMFENNITSSYTKSYIKSICKMHKYFCPSDIATISLEEDLNDVSVFLKNNSSLLESKTYTIKTALDYLYNIIDNGENLSVQQIFREFSYSVPFYSTILAIELPELFVPYYFIFNFQVLEDICIEFDILIPEIPNKKDYLNRFYYYGELCASFLEFRKKHNLTQFEFLAFLYDYAPNVTGGKNKYISNNLPKASNAFLIGAPADCDDLKNDKSFCSYWQCNEDTQIGDYAVMYLKNPISSINSVWRCVSKGYIDPLFYYYHYAYIAKPISIDKISKSELEKDDIFKSNSLVCKNMQGVNGWYLKPSEFNHLMDLGNAPKLKLDYSMPLVDVEISKEKDVENKLIKRLLTQLKYKECDYTQQFRIKLGNHNTALIPDFVLLPNSENKTAFAIIEAKITIPNKKALETVKVQAKSYARQLLAKYCIIASQEKVWIYCINDDYSKEIFSATWEDICKPDTFATLNKLIKKR
ncbi:MAG: type I restriction enzyme HsdR N-terminal domain-containing protein [Eubacteriales bacterium]|nr:type I restriction enzyme HsdR N-terminal domain-containing protein [Eubacteriales bacterium]